MNGSRLRGRAIVWSFAVLVSAIVVVFAFSMYPVADGDAIFFVPAIKAYASSGVLENKLVDLSYETDPKGLGRFLFYTPGFPFAFGSAMRMLGLSSYKETLILLSFARVGSILLFAKVVLILLQRANRLASPFFVFIASALVISNGLFLFASNGRPEILSVLIVSVSLVASLSIHSMRSRHLSLSACISLLFAVSIASGIVAFSFYLFYLLFDIKNYAFRIAFVAMVPLLGCLLIALSYFAADLPLLDGIRGLAMHSKMALNRSGGGLGLIASYWKTWVLFGIIAFASLVFRALSFPHLHERPMSAVDRLWLASAFLMLAWGIYLFGLRSAPIHYNLYAFLPLYQALAIQLLLRPGVSEASFTKFGLGGLVGVALVASLVDPLRTTLLFPYYFSSGSTFDQAKNEFDRLGFGECALMYSGGLFLLDESQKGSLYDMAGNSSHPLLSERIKSDSKHRKCTVVAVQEINGNNSKAPAALKKIVDFSDGSPLTSRLRALRILNSPKGYSFNAYIDSCRNS